MNAKLYMATLPNGKGYVGITTKPLWDRKSKHWNEARKRPGKTLFGRALLKHGIDAAQFKVLVIGELEYIKEMERKAIVAFGTKAPFGYNLTDGGDGVFGLSDESRERIAAGQRGRRMPDHVRRAVSAAQKGRVHTPEHRHAAGSAFRGKKRSPEEIAKRVATRRARRNGAYL